MSNNLIKLLFLITIYLIVSINSQILRRQYITDSQQLQVPVRRIQIPYDLQKSLKPSDQRPESRDTTVDRECPKCLEKRLVQHYMARGCTPVIRGGCDCPSKYECPQSDRLIDSDSRVCWYRGKAYPLEASIPNQNPCRICKCRSVGRDVQIDCSATVECPAQSTAQRLNNECYGFFEHRKCCARDECQSSSNALNKVCNYKGIQYRIGEKIALEDNRCMSCICSQEWDDNKPLDLYSCRKVECDLELNAMFRSGCTPIYREDKCCPIDYNCPKRNQLRIRGLENGSLMCDFEGRKYPIGSKLYTDNKCASCVCQMPPQFTCTQKHNCY